jgi:TPP-dependent pyruvate/acetoin dehydrogenase alpha subunit
MDNLEIYKEMYRIRLFEETILDLFTKNRLFGTTHTYIGQEAIAVAAIKSLNDNDFIFSNHRCHGHFLAYSKRMDILLAEIMGRADGVCQGIGGSQHICYKNFYSNGIQGGIVPNATGMAFAEKIKGTGNIGINFIGDGTLGQGIVYESLNMASLYQIPILYVIENNQYAMSTKISDAMAGTIGDRLKAFNIEYDETNSNDVSELTILFEKDVNFVRKYGKPYCQIINTYRFSPHSKGDDFRDPYEVLTRQKDDPLKKQQIKCDSELVKKAEKEIQQELKDAVSFAENGGGGGRGGRPPPPHTKKKK